MQGSWLRTACSQRQLEIVVVQVEAALDDPAQVGLDRELVLRGGRHDAGLKDRARPVDLIAVEEQPPGRLGGAGPAPFTRGVTASAGGSGGSYASTSDSASSQANTSSTARTTMLWNGFVHTGTEPGRRGRFGGERGEGGRS